MKINNISTLKFSSNNTNNQSVKQEKFTDKFQTKLKNVSDMQDCITVPRTIFKGYLGIMTGTTLGSIASLMKPSKLKKAVALTGIATALYGTWAFVRPYITKGVVPTVDLNKENKTK